MSDPPERIPPDETIATDAGDATGAAGAAGARSHDAASRSASPPEPASSFLPGDRLADRYRIDAFIARGGMGEVYRAHDLELGVDVALKTIRPEIAMDPAALRNFKQEVLTARSVTHPNVCRIYDLGRHHDPRRDVSFLTMEFLDGETLAARLATRGRLSGEEAISIVRQLAEGLDAAHRAGIVHRDFKSANVLLVAGASAGAIAGAIAGASAGAGGERAVITDFGLALGADTTRPEGRSEGPGLRGTPSHMAPEQVRGERVGHGADLYALGVTLFEMRTGVLPFREKSALQTALARLTNPPPRPSALVEIETAWEDAILRLLSLDVADRFKSAGDAVRALSADANADADANAPSANASAAPRKANAAQGKANGPGHSSSASSSLPRHSLPAEHDAFVGRRDALLALADALESSPALVTLLGAGGAGKTRLARRYGWESLARWPGGVWFCDLSEARDASGVVAAVASALDATVAKGDPIAQLGHAIAGRGRALLILDNFEQVAGDAAATLGGRRGLGSRSRRRTARWWSISSVCSMDSRSRSSWRHRDSACSRSSSCARDWGIDSPSSQARSAVDTERCARRSTGRGRC